MKTAVHAKSIIAFFETQAKAEEAIAKLHQNGSDMSLFSIVALNLFAVENVKGYYNVLDHMKKWGKIGAFYGGFWGLLFGANVFSIPFLGHLLISSPLTVLIVTLVSALGVGILSALGAALFNLKIHAKHKLKYETEIKGGKYMLLGQGNDEFIAQAREILEIRVPKDFLAAKECGLSQNAAPNSLAQPEIINLDNI